MGSDEQAVPAARRAGRRFEAGREAELCPTCRRQTAVIEALMRAVGDLRSGAGALKVENEDLRAERRRLHRDRVQVAFAGGADAGDRVEEQVSLGVNAPAMARRIVADALRERVALSVVERAKLTISELVTNSVCHGITPRGGYAIVRLHLTGERVRLEVEDPGHGGSVVQGRPNARTGGGFGLHVVETISERWGSERCAGGAMRVWAELTLAPEAAQDSRPEPAPEPREEVRVVPEPRAGTWSVYLDAMDTALSQHDSQTAAEEAARVHAALHACRRIVVHDRYFRTRSLAVRGRSDQPAGT